MKANSMNANQSSNFMFLFYTKKLNLKLHTSQIN